MKTLLKYIAGVVLGNNCSFRLSRSLSKNRLIVLYYHRVVHKEECKEIDPREGMYTDIDVFAKQMEFLKKYYNFVSESSIVKAIENNKPLTDYPLWLTFDDGWSDNYINAFPILRKYNIPATFFVTTGYIDGIFSPNKFRRKDYFMAWQQIKEVSEHGISIGAHTVSHRSLSSLSDGEIEKEIATSKDEIERRIGNKVISFAYPFGKGEHFDSQKCLPILKKNNFKLAVTTIGGFNTLDSTGDTFNLRRIGLSYDDTISIFKFKIGIGSFWQK